MSPDLEGIICRKFPGIRTNQNQRYPDNVIRVGFCLNAILEVIYTFHCCMDYPAGGYISIIDWEFALEIIVIGMHRSGTSLVCSILNKMGVYFGDAAMLMRDQSNEKGYFERFQVNEVQDYILRISGYSWVKISDYDVDCLGGESQHIFDSGMKSFFNECHDKSMWGVKDPRTCLTFPLWKKHLKQPVCVFAFRNPCHVAASLCKRDGFPVEFGLALWEKYNVLGLNNIRGLPRQSDLILLKMLVY